MVCALGDFRSRRSAGCLVFVTVSYREGTSLPVAVELHVQPPDHLETDVEVARRIVTAFEAAGKRLDLHVSPANRDPFLAHVERWVLRHDRSAFERGQTAQAIEYTAIEDPRGPVRPRRRRRPPEDTQAVRARVVRDLWEDDDG